MQLHALLLQAGAMVQELRVQQVQQVRRLILLLSAGIVAQQQAGQQVKVQVQVPQQQQVGQLVLALQRCLGTGGRVTAVQQQQQLRRLGTQQQ
jgi:hypothetical protein